MGKHSNLLLRKQEGKKHKIETARSYPPNLNSWIHRWPCIHLQFYSSWSPEVHGLVFLLGIYGRKPSPLAMESAEQNSEAGNGRRWICRETDEKRVLVCLSVNR